MKKFDLRKIKRALEHGDIRTVADNAGVHPRVVTEVLTRGWHTDVKNEVVAAALDVIRDKGENPELLKEAENLKFTSDTFLTVQRKPQHKFKKGNSYGRRSRRTNPVWLVAGGAALFFVLFGKGLVSKLTGKTL